jgi:hypothetical protein
MTSCVTFDGRVTPSALETRCIGICPKKAVTALNASRPDKILTIPKGTAADEAIAQLVDVGQAPAKSTADP